MISQLAMVTPVCAQIVKARRAEKEKHECRAGLVIPTGDAWYIQVVTNGNSEVTADWATQK